jgi:hypothetical protein
MNGRRFAMNALFLVTMVSEGIFALGFITV